MKRVGRRPVVTIVAALVVVLVVVSGLWQVSKSRTFQFFGEITARVETDDMVVALTFDDAPTEFTRDVLDVLRQKTVTATFYAIGENIAEHPDIIRSVVEAGHELGNHSYSHKRMVFNNETPGFVRNEIERTNELIREAGYTGEITFRPPYGKKLFVLPWYLARAGIRTVTWDVEPDTAHSGDADAIVAEVTEQTRPGSIILMHPFCAIECEADRRALPRIIDDLRAAGFRLVTVSELLGH